MTHTRKLYSILAVSLRDSDKQDEALCLLEQGLEHYPEDPELHFHAAILLNSMKRHEEAKTHLTAYGEDVSDHFSSIDTGILTYKRWSLLADTALQLGDYAMARRWFATCIEREPSYPHAAVGLFEAALKFGDLTRANLALDAFLKAVGPIPQWADMARRYAFAAGGQQNVVPFLAALTARYPLSHEPRVTLVRALLSEGRGEECRRHLEILLAQSYSGIDDLVAVARSTRTRANPSAQFL